MDSYNILLDWALYYASLGWHVLPLWGITDGACQCGNAECKSPGKHPHSRLAPHGVKDARADEGTIRTWFGAHPTINLGIATGSVSGLLVQDVDGDEGRATLAGRDVPSAPLVTTGNGEHHYFAYESGHKSAARVLPGIDIRTDGGYVVAPPSRHASGVRYTWAEGRRPSDLVLCAAPEHLRRAAKERGASERTTSTAAIPEGRRNAELTSIAGSLRRSGADVHRIEQRLLEINSAQCAPPLDAGEIHRIATSVGSYSSSAGPLFEEALAPLLELGADADPPAIELALRDVARRLDGADSVRRELCKVEAKKILGTLGMKGPGRLVDTALAVSSPNESSDKAQANRILLLKPEPWPNAVDGAWILDTIVDVFTSHVILPRGAAVGLALWVLHTYAYDARSVSPRLAITSPEKRCAKTLVLTILQHLVCKPLPASNVSPASVFRAIDAHVPTLLIDEADTFLDGKSDLRGILNSGHSRPCAHVLRTHGDDHEPRLFSTWAPAAIALIGSLPATLEDRSVTVRMRRRLESEVVERFSEEAFSELADTIRRACARWAQDNFEALRALKPLRPDWLDDRACDNWGVLFGIAHLCGREWLERATSAARALSESRSENEGSTRIQLLDDIRALFQSRRVDRLPSSDIVDHLVKLEDRPWAELNRGRPLTPQTLSRLLREYGIVPVSIRLKDGRFPKGYHLDRFQDAFKRYLPPETDEEGPLAPPLPV